MTYVLWGLVILHLLLLDGPLPFQNNGLDGDPVFHQRFYQVVAISIPLFVLRLPPVRKWVIEQRTAGRAWLAWLVMSPLWAFFLIAVIFMINEEFYTGLKVITMTHLFHN
jgi:hypothetical protein